MTTSDNSPRPFPALVYRPTVLRDMRHRLGYSMETVALYAGLHDKAQISRFEHGRAIPLVTTLGRVLHVLQPEPADLYNLFNLPQHFMRGDTR